MTPHYMLINVMFNHGHWKLKDFFKVVPPVSKVDNIHFILIQAKMMHFFGCSFLTG